MTPLGRNLSITSRETAAMPKAKGDRPVLIKKTTYILFIIAFASGCPTEDDDVTAVDYCADFDPSEPVPDDWVSISGGTFMMGSEDGEGIPGLEFMLDEQPIHPVNVPSFEMWRTEVTVEQYSQCFCSGTCSEPGVEYGERTNWAVHGRGSHPINGIIWEQAVDFCTWAGGRLPSEAEWEYAARSGGKDVTYPWGDDQATCDYAVMNQGYLGCGESHTFEVCSRPAGNTDHGLCDMSGNEEEWTQDTYHQSYIGAPSDGSAWETTTTTRVLRGGDFASNYTRLRVTERRGAHAIAGIRCAR